MTRVKINKIENKNSKKKSMKQKTVSLKKSIKLTNFLQNFIKKDRKHKLPVSGRKQGHNYRPCTHQKDKEIL